MYNLTGFIANNGIANNNKRVVAPLGELSTYAQTFSRDRGIFFDTDKPLAALYSFASYQEISATEVEDRPVNQSVALLARDIAQVLYTFAEQGDLDNNPDTIRDIVLARWVGDVQNVIVGAMVSDGNRWMPSSLTWNGTSSEAPYRAKFWFSDEPFRNEYDLFEVEVALPIEDLVTLFATPSEMDQILATKLTSIRLTQKITDVADGDPYTDAITDEFEWISAQNREVSKILPITTVIYGDAGRSPDIRRKAIADYLLANSNISEDSWREILPDVFSPTEFIFAPNWNRYALPSGTIRDWSSGEYPEGVLSAGTYMSSGNAKSQIEFMKDFAKGVGYTPEYVENTTNLVGFVYKSLQACVIGGYRNRDDVTQFADRWPDYMAVGTGMGDFARMSEETQRMIEVVIDMFRVAETMTITSTIPRKYTRATRDGILYLTATFERTQLMVVSRTSVAALYKYTTGSQNEKWS